MKVFLGGTTNETTWRDELIEMLEIDFFNPVVDDWNEAAMARERQERADSDYVLYVLTPKMMGVFSVAEVVDDSNKRPEETLLVVLGFDRGATFAEHWLKSLGEVEWMVRDNGARVMDSLEAVAGFLNEQGRRSSRAQEHEARFSEPTLDCISSA